jgi:hypothetical protein
MRFRVPVGAMVGAGRGQPQQDEIRGDAAGPSMASSNSAIGKLVVLLEENREMLGVEHYSVSPTTLDQVFLTVVGRHNVKEEGYEQKAEKKGWWRFGM